MTTNMGQADRVIRVVVGIVLLAATFGFGVGTGWVQWVMAIVGVVMIVTAALGNCPLYTLFGIRTCRT